MKGIYTIAIAFLACWTVTNAYNIPTKCPAVDPIDKTIHLPHENDCTKFYKCLGGEKIIQQCPFMNKEGDRLHFNPRLQVCDSPDNAGCQPKTFVQNQPEEANVQSVLQEESDEISTMQNVCPPNPHPWNTTIHIPHETDCTKFYMCLGTYKVVRDCPFMDKAHTRRLHFNAREQVCDWPGRAGCRGSPFMQDQPEEINAQSVLQEENDKTLTMNNILADCPAEIPKNTTIHIPHESDCTKFYMCLGKIKILQECPAGLHFSPRLQVCDWPERAGCQTKTFVQDQPEEANVQSVLQEESDEISTMQNVCPPNPHPWNTTIHIPHETDCTKFYMCLGTYKVVRDCPFMDKAHTRRLHFNAREQVCDWPGRAGCRGRPFMQDQPEEINAQSVLQEESDEISTMQNVCPSNPHPWNTTILIPHETDCTKFYMCLGKTKTLQECPAGLHFSPRLQVCDWPENAGCKTKTFVQDQPEEANVQSILQEESDKISTMQNVCPPNPHPWNTTIHIPHETDCTKFYMCLGTYKVVRDCPFMDKARTRRLHFNAHEQVCDWPGRAGCQKNPLPGGACDGERYLPHEHNCGMFYECKEDNKILRECVDGMYFSIKWQGCVKYEDSECTEKKPPVKCSRKDELLSHECDCTKYYKCREDDEILLYCENGLHFSAKHQKCMKPSEAGCDPNEVIKPGDCPKPQPEHPWRHECDCRLFYKCVDGKKRIHECSWGSYFNTKTGKCDSPKNVQGCENNLGDSF